MYAGALMGTLIGMLFKKGLSNVVEQAIGSVDVWVSVLCAGIIGPVAEELFFRKAMIDRLSKFHPTDAILFSALLFGLIHGNLTQFLYAFPLGILLGIIYYHTQNIGYTILLHAALNALGGLVPQLLTGPAEGEASIVLLLGSAVFGLFVLAMFITGVVLLIVKRKQFLPIPSDRPHCGKPFFLNAGFIVACIAFIALFVLTEILA